MYDMKQIVNIINKEIGIKTFKFDFSFYNSYIALMNNWYNGYVPDCHTYDSYNGIKTRKVKKCRINMAKHICEDHASLTFNENININIDGDAEKEFILGHEEMTGVLGSNNFWTLGSRLYELVCALGTGAVEVVLSNMLKINNNIAVDKHLTKIKLIQHNAFDIIPLSWDSNYEIKEIAFVSNYVENKKNIINVRLHVIEDNNYIIYNKRIENINNRYILLNDTDNKTLERFDTGSDIPWFSVLKLPIVNNYDIDSPFGASVYANSIDVLKTVDEGFNILFNEFSVGNKKIFYNKKLLKRHIGSGDETNISYDVPDDYNVNLFFFTGDDLGLTDEAGGKLPIYEFNPTLRIDSIIYGIQNSLNFLSTMCGLGSNYYKFNGSSVEKTATEVISENSSMYRGIRRNELAVEKFILNIIKACLYIGNSLLKLDLNINTKVSVQFDASIIEDKTSIRERDLKEVDLGIMTVEEYRNKWYTSNRRDSVNLSKTVDNT